MKVIRDEKIFKVKRKIIINPPLVKQKKTVNELIEIIDNLLESKKLSLGFTQDNSPDKDWLIVLFKS